MDCLRPKATFGECVSVKCGLARKFSLVRADAGSPKPGFRTLVVAVCALLICAALFLIAHRRPEARPRAASLPPAAVETTDTFMAPRASSASLAPLRRGEADASVEKFHQLRTCLLASQAPEVLARAERSRV